MDDRDATYAALDKLLKGSDGPWGPEDVWSSADRERKRRLEAADFNRQREAELAFWQEEVVRASAEVARLDAVLGELAAEEIAATGARIH